MSDGSPPSRLRRAMAARTLVQVRSAAADMPHVGLADAAAILAPIADQERGSCESAESGDDGCPPAERPAPRARSRW